jgi:TonB family protein
MKLTVLSIITSCLLSTTLMFASNQGRTSSQRTPANEKEHQKSEVELMLAEAKKHGEAIIATCIEKCGEDAEHKVAEGVETGNALELPAPPYPPLAARARVTGQVQVQVIIDKNGKVIAASALSGHPLLQHAAVTAAKKALFNPFKLDGKPVKVLGVIVYNFSQ